MNKHLTNYNSKHEISNDASTIHSDGNGEAAIRRRLEEIVNRIIISGHTCESDGLSYGKMGIVIFLFHYARYSRDNSFENNAMELIEEIQASLQIDDFLDHAFGLSGIGSGIEYLAQHGFIDPETDELLEEFDNLFAEQVEKRKLYLSAQDLTDLKRYFTARLENPQTKRRDFLLQTMEAVSAIQELHNKVFVELEDTLPRKFRSDDPVIWGLEGLAGKGLSLLSALDPQHNAWVKLK